MNLKNDKLAQANELIKATKSMGTLELKTFFYACTVREPGETTIEVPYQHLCKKLNISKGGKQKELFEKACINIMSKDIIKLDSYENRTKKRIIGHLLTTINYDDNKVKIKFNETFLPLLDNLKSNYTWIYLEQLAKLDGKYSTRIYEFSKMILKQQQEIKYRWYLETKGSNDIGIKEFLGIENLKTYNRFNSIRQQIIEPSIKEINEKINDLTITYEVYYKGKKAEAIDLTITNKSNNILLKDYDDEIKNLEWWNC